MGCDIHLWVEVRRGTTWQFANPSRLVSDDGEEWTEWDPPYDRRNYFLFGILAGVRNRDGLVRPISPARGAPGDLSDIGQLVVRQWAADAHSTSWLGADELLSHDWDTPVHLSGYVTLEAEALYLTKGCPPDEWHERPEGRCVASLAWIATERELCREFIDSFLPALKGYGTPESVRTCFFFDN